MDMWLLAATAVGSAMLGEGLVHLAIRKHLRLRYFFAALLVAALLGLRTGLLDRHGGIPEVVVIFLVAGVFGSIIRARARDLV